MAVNFNPSNFVDPFVLLPDEQDQLYRKLMDVFREYADGINVREISYYPLTEMVTGKLYYTPGNPQNFRDIFRKIIPIGAIAAGATATIPHGITGITQVLLTDGSAITDAPDFRVIPYASATLVTDQTQVRVTSTNVIVVNGATAPNITTCDITLEYLKQ